MLLFLIIIFNLMHVIRSANFALSVSYVKYVFIYFDAVNNHKSYFWKQLNSITFCSFIRCFNFGDLPNEVVGRDT